MKATICMFALLFAFAGHGAELPAEAEVAVAKRLKELKVEKIGSELKVLKSTQTDQNTVLLVGIPVTVNLGDACTEMAGQETEMVKDSQDKTWERLVAMGSYDVQADACIQVLPEPVETHFTTTMELPRELPEQGRFQKIVLIGDNWLRLTYVIGESQGDARRF